MIFYNLLKLLYHYNCLQIESSKQTVVSKGIRKGYLPNIDFTKLPERIYKFKEELHNICKKKSRSYYNVDIS